MPVTTRSGVSTPRAWGTSYSDFHFRARKTRRAPRSSSRGAKKQKRGKCSQLPELATAPDDFQQVVEALAKDEEILGYDANTASEVEVEGFDHGGIFTDTAELSESELRMRASVMDMFITEIERVCGPVPEMDSRELTL